MADLSEHIELTTLPNGQVVRIVVDGTDISGWIAGSEVTVTSDHDTETRIHVSLTAPTISYTQLED